MANQLIKLVKKVKVVFSFWASVQEKNKEKKLSMKLCNNQLNATVWKDETSE